MDSRLAADPIARHILDILGILEKAAGVRAHYRILDPPPLTTVDRSSIQTTARVLGDWIGLRNAVFNVSIIEHDAPPRLLRIDPDREEFIMELPAAALASPEAAIAAITRQVSRAYLVTSNIAGSSVDINRTAGSMADVTAIFLGMGKFLLNAPGIGSIPLPKNIPSLPENQPLTPEYVAFTHRIVCSMRGLDWSQHTSGLSAQTISLLRNWDQYRDTVFSQALRNVLTAAASHRPLMDAIEDNHLALARFDQLHRVFQTTFLAPLQVELERYHQTCREGMERLNAREQETYDPCLLYLNQLRRRMDLQRYADMLLLQQDHVINRLRVLTAGLADLNARRLVHTEGVAEKLQHVICPFDGTVISIPNDNQDSRVKCPTCAYTFLASPGLPNISALAAPPPESEPADTEESSKKQPVILAEPSQKKLTPKPKSNTAQPATTPRKISTGTKTLAAGIIILPLGWLPMLGYVFVQILRGREMPLATTLGKIGVWGSFIALCVIFAGILMLLIGWAGKKRHVAAT